jgi:hypothetical protein
VFNYHFDWAIITSGQYFEWISIGGEGHATRWLEQRLAWRKAI